MPLREARRTVCAVRSERRCARGVLVFPVPPVRRIVMKELVDESMSFSHGGKIDAFITFTSRQIFPQLTLPLMVRDP